MLPLVEQLKNFCHNRINSLKDTAGFNMAALKFIKQKVEENEQVRLFSDLTLKHRENKKNKKKQVTLVSLKSAAVS